MLLKILFKGSIKAKFCGVITKPISQTKSFKIPKKLLEAVTTLQSTSATLHLGNATLQSTNATLQSGNATLHSLFVGLYLILSKLNPSIIHQIINIKYFIYNVKGLHFNLAFINYNKYRVHLIIFKLLFNRKHQYWAESDYFSWYRYLLNK